MATEKKQNWNARMRVTVIKNVRLENCTEAEAQAAPWEHAVHEQESDQVDWSIEKLEPAE